MVQRSTVVNAILLCCAVYLISMTYIHSNIAFPHHLQPERVTVRSPELEQKEPVVIEDPIIVDNFKASLETLLPRLQYWEYLPKLSPPNAGGVLPSSTASEKEHFLTFEVDHGGFNNIRLQFETVVVLAHLLNRTLVLPPKQRYYLIGNDVLLEHFYDVHALRDYMRVISAEEYLKAHGNPSGMTSSKEIYKYYREHSDGAHPQYQMHDDVVAIPSIAECKAKRDHDYEEFYYPKLTSFVDYRKLHELNTSIVEAETVHIISNPGKGYRLFGLWYPFFYFSDPNWHRFYVSLLRTGFHYQPALYTAAAKVITELVKHQGLYHALHIRRGDFQYTQTRLEANEILDNVLPLLKTFPEVKTLYIATDERNATFFAPFLESGYTVKFFHDFPDVEEATRPEFHGMVEQIVCTGGQVFIGTELSTFSAHITRLRYQVGQDVAPDKGIYFTTRKYTGEPSNDMKESIATWINGDDKPNWPHAVYFREWWPYLDIDEQ